MMKGCLLLIVALVLAAVLLVFNFYTPKYSREASYVIVAVLMTVIIGQSEASIIAKLLALVIIWIATIYILIF